MPNLEKAGIDVPDVSREENWLPIKDFDGLYECSDLGRIRSVDRLVPHGVGNKHGIGPDGRMRHRKGRIIKLTDNKHTGHKRVMLSKLGIHTTHGVHVLVKLTFDGPQPEGRIVCHDNGDPTDNRIENLYWGTTQDNCLDKERHGTNHQLNKDTCPLGHLYSGRNLIASMRNTTISGPGPQRNCRACDNARSSRSNLRRQGRPEPDFKTLADAKYAKIMGGAKPQPRKKLTHADAAEILQALLDGAPDADIGRKFGVPAKTVLQLRRGEHWTQKSPLDVPAQRVESPAVVKL